MQSLKRLQLTCKIYICPTNDVRWCATLASCSGAKRQISRTDLACFAKRRQRKCWNIGSRWPSSDNEHANHSSFRQGLPSRSKIYRLAQVPTDSPPCCRLHVPSGPHSPACLYRLRRDWKRPLTFVQNQLIINRRPTQVVDSILRRQQ